MSKTIFNLSTTNSWNRDANLLTPCSTKKIALKLAKQDAKNKKKQFKDSRNTIHRTNEKINSCR